MKTGTVQKPLSTGEAFEFGAAVMQQLVYTISGDTDKVRKLRKSDFRKMLV